MSGALLVAALRSPELLGRYSPTQWTSLVRTARAENLLGTIAALADRASALPSVRPILDDAALFTARSHQESRWEAMDVARVLRPLGIEPVLLKGAAYIASESRASVGRLAGDLDILVPRFAVETAEALLLDNGWRRIKTDPYDDSYYRRWMHEVPPLIHDARQTVLDLHHTILPLTARLTPDAERLYGDSVESGIAGARMLCAEDQVLHSAVHLFHDGDLVGGLRNLWDLHCLLEEFGSNPHFSDRLHARAQLHGLELPLFYTLRYTVMIFGTAVGGELARSIDGPPAPILWIMDRLVRTRFLGPGVDRWPLSVRAANLLLYTRSHWLRMPPLMLATHLWTKWRMRRG